MTIISGDKAKTQAYCDIRKLSEQIEEASAKKDSKTVEELSLKIETLEKALGPEYVALVDDFRTSSEMTCSVRIYGRNRITRRTVYEISLENPKRRQWRTCRMRGISLFLSPHA